MRTETIINEARMFDREDECYIHVERTQSGNFRTMCTGDPDTITQAIFNLLCLMEDKTGAPVDRQLKLYKTVYRKKGAHKPVSRIPVSEAEES